MVDLSNIVGGSLHIVLADGNTEREHIEFCLADAEAHSDYVGVALAKCLLEMSEAEVDMVYESVSSGFCNER